MNVKQRRAAAIQAAQAVIARAKAEGRGSFTPSELAEVKAHQATVLAADAEIEAARPDQELFAAMSASGPVEGTKMPWERQPDPRMIVGGAAGGKQFLSFNLKAAGVAPSGAIGVKALLAEGSSASPKVIDGGIVAQGRPAASLLDVLPVVVHGAQPDGGSPVYSYLRQTLRTENADTVAKGGLKPSSSYGLTRINGRLKVVAHVSEAIDVYDLRDNANLSAFLQLEMAAGVAAAITGQVLNGDGLGENLQGLNSVSGILAQAFSGDKLTTLRKTLTSLELVGSTPAAVVLHPTDWESIELTREDGTTGGYMLDGGPVDVAARRLWGVPVVCDAAVALGTGWTLGADAVTLRTDVQAVELTWGLVGDDFQRNQVRARAEIRADLAVVRPGAIVKAALTA